MDTDKSASPSSLDGNSPVEDELCPLIDPVNGTDLSLIAENLKLTPWERLINNNDTINFIDQARTAMALKNAAA